MVSNLRQAGLGPSLRLGWVAYQHRLSEELARRGFPDRQVPDGRVLRLVANGDAVTISALGRQLAITRQGAGKLVAGLRDRGYVDVTSSPTDGREKLVAATELGLALLAARRASARAIERRVAAAVGPTAMEGFRQVLAALDDDTAPRPAP